MAFIYDSKGVKKKVTLLTYYNLDGDYITFPDNPLHGKTYKNVGVVISDKISATCGIKFREQIIYITNSNEEPIGCELLDCIEDGDDLIIRLCQDWG